MWSAELWSVDFSPSEDSIPTQKLLPIWHSIYIFGGDTIHRYLHWKFKEFVVCYAFDETPNNWEWFRNIFASAYPFEIFSKKKSIATVIAIAWEVYEKLIWNDISVFTRTYGTELMINFCLYTLVSYAEAIQYSESNQNHNWLLVLFIHDLGNLWENHPWWIESRLKSKLLMELKYKPLYKVCIIIALFCFVLILHLIEVKNVC